MELYRAYLSKIEEILWDIVDSQQDAMEQAAKAISKSIAANGLVYVFGCGHSHMLAEEGFYRAGGLGAVCPILPPEFMLHEGAVKSSDLERRAELASGVLSRYPLNTNDILIVFSTSGINGMPVEIAKLGKESGSFVIGVSSSEYVKDSSRHPNGVRLSEVCDLHIDNCVPYGDAVYELYGTSKKMGPVSTLAGVYILNCMLARGAELSTIAGAKPFIYVSGNIHSGREKNLEIIQHYHNQIRAL